MPMTAPLFLESDTYTSTLYLFNPLNFGVQADVTPYDMSGILPVSKVVDGCGAVISSGSGIPVVLPASHQSIGGLHIEVLRTQEWSCREKKGLGIKIGNRGRTVIVLPIHVLTSSPPAIEEKENDCYTLEVFLAEMHEKRIALPGPAVATLSGCRNEPGTLK